MRWVEKVKRGRIEGESFQFSLRFSTDAIFFIFHQLRVGAKNTTFPFSILCTYSQTTVKNVIGKFFAFFYTQLTRQSGSADTKLFSIPAFIPTPSSHQPPTPFPSNKESLCQGKRLFYFILVCSLRKSTELKILMTLTLNQNEVAINYIKYDIVFWSNASPTSSSLCVCDEGKKVCMYIAITFSCL